MTEELKPCPFCGSMPRIVNDIRYPRPERKPIDAYEIVCDNPDCIIYGCDSNYFDSKEKAIKVWNRRTNNEID